MKSQFIGGIASITIAIVITVATMILTIQLDDSIDSNQKFIEQIAKMERVIETQNEQIEQLSKMGNQTSHETPLETNDILNRLEILEKKIDGLEPQIVINTVEQSNSTFGERLSITILPALITGIFGVLGYKLLTRPDTG